MIIFVIESSRVCWLLVKLFIIAKSLPNLVTSIECDVDNIFLDFDSY